MSKIVIIGSGLGGLSSGYILQRHGYDVTVLEQSTQIGGCLQCFTRRGAKFETGMHFIGSAAPGQTMNRLMNYMGLSDDVHLSSLDTSAYNTITLGGDNFCFANGYDAFIEQMSLYFPREHDNLVRYVQLIKRIASASALNSLTSDQRDVNANTEYQTLSINEVLDELFHDSLLKQVLVGDLPLYSAELDRTPFTQHAFIMDFYNQSAYRIVGGSDSIAHSLQHNIQKLGGQVLSRQRVTRIICNDERAVGVETADGNLFPADYIISTIHPNRMLELLDTRLIRPAFRTRIQSIPQTAGGFAVYVKFRDQTMPYMNTNFFGYNGRTPWNCEHYTADEWPKGYLYMHMCHQDHAQWAQSGVILSYMNYQDVAQWAGTFVGHRGEDYVAFKEQHAQRLMAEVEKHHPGFSANVDSYYTSTPLTYVDYTGTEGGSMYGVAKDISLGAAGRVPYRTKVPNLFLAGQNVNSHGMLGVLVGTIVACSALVPAEDIYKEIAKLS